MMSKIWTNGDKILSVENILGKEWIARFQKLSAVDVLKRVSVE